MPNLRTFLDCSTAHLTAETRAMLDSTPADQWPVSGCPAPYGYFVYAHDENLEDRIPSDLWAVLAFATQHGAAYVLFDADAADVDDLPTYAAL